MASLSHVDPVFKHPALECCHAAGKEPRLAWRAIVVACLTLLSLSSAAAQSTSPLWGQLKAGPFAVGYRVIYAHDRSRTWATTRAFGKPFAPDKSGRPVRISIWYPARSPANPARMYVRDYVHNKAPAEFASANTAIESRDRRVLAEMVPADAFPALMGLPMQAIRDAPPSKGRFPLLLYSAGINEYTISNAIMAEYLASHGYVVATVPSLGRSDLDTEQTYDSIQIEDVVRDMEFAYGEVVGLPYIDRENLGVFGHSLGGTVAMMFAMRNRNVQAVVGLDGTYGFSHRPGSETLTTYFGYAPLYVRASILDIHREDPGLLPDVVRSMRFSNRYSLILKQVRHTDFTSYAMIAEVMHVPGLTNATGGWTRETGSVGFQHATEVAEVFFDDILRHQLTGEQFETKAEQITGQRIHLQSNVEPPPDIHLLVRIAMEQGFDAATRVLDQAKKNDPDDPMVDSKALNSFGYNLIDDGKYADAIAAFRLNTYANPKSANAEDSLGDAYLAAKQSADARAAFERAIALIPNDPDLDAGAKKSLAESDREKIQQLSSTTR
jgi:dienelactone hydrolase